MELRRLIVTNKGQELMARVLSGNTTITFTKIAVSPHPYEDGEILGLTELEEIKQESTSLSSAWKGDSAIQIQTAFENSQLKLGYNIYTFGLYARAFSENEILFAVASANVPAYMPACNGITVSGIHVKLTFAMSNAQNVNLTVDPAAVATVGDIQILQTQIKKLESRMRGGNICLIRGDGMRFEIGIDERGVFLEESDYYPDAVVLKAKTLNDGDTVAVALGNNTYGVENAANSAMEDIPEGGVVFSVVD